MCYSPNMDIYTAGSVNKYMEKNDAGPKDIFGVIINGVLNIYSMYPFIFRTMEGQRIVYWIWSFGANHCAHVFVLPEQIPKERLEAISDRHSLPRIFSYLTPLDHSFQENPIFRLHNDPKMSMHLWMMRDYLKYFCNLFQIQQGLLSVRRSV